jgi:hypothetical protein
MTALRDRDVRKALLGRLHDRFGDDAQTRIVEELGLLHGDCRIDVAVINGQLSGFEIKSERDTLQRLPDQAATYSKIFDFVTLVAPPAHLQKAESWLPGWWGLTTVTRARGGRPVLRRVRQGARNRTVDLAALAHLLWRD